MDLSDEVRELYIPEPGQWWLVKDKLADRIAALEAERDELAAELKKHCGCEFDPITAECTVTCQTHKRVQEEVDTLKSTIRTAYFWIKGAREDDSNGVTHCIRILKNAVISMGD